MSEEKRYEVEFVITEMGSINIKANSKEDAEKKIIEMRDNNLEELKQTALFSETIIDGIDADELK